MKILARLIRSTAHYDERQNISGSLSFAPMSGNFMGHANNPSERPTKQIWQGRAIGSIELGFVHGDLLSQLPAGDYEIEIKKL
jgi:hypothetical protein